MPLYIWTALNCILKRGFLQCDISSSHIVTNKRIYFWYFFHHLCCCWSVEKLVIRVLCLFWRKVLLKGCIKPASINPPTAPKQSSSQSPSQRLQPLNTEQRRQELPLNLKHTIILSLPLSLSLTHTHKDRHTCIHILTQLTTLSETAHTYAGIWAPRTLTASDVQPHTPFQQEKWTICELFRPPANDIV